MGVREVRQDPIVPMPKPLPKGMPAKVLVPVRDEMKKSALLPFTPTRPTLPKPSHKKSAPQTGSLDSPPLPKRKKHANMGDIAQMVEDIDFTRAVARIHAKFQILTQVDFRNFISDAFFEKMEERRKKIQDKEAWAHKQTMASLLGGTAIGAVGVLTGNVSSAFIGAVMCSRGLSSLLQEYASVPSVIGGIALSAAALTGLGALYGTVVVAGNLPTMIVTVISGATALTQGFNTYMSQKTQSEQLEIDADTTKLDMERTKSTDAIKKSLGSMKSQDQVRLSEAASALIADEAEMNRKIIRKR